MTGPPVVRTDWNWRPQAGGAEVANGWGSGLREVVVVVVTA